jgi:hypothetical protein
MGRVKTEGQLPVVMYHTVGKPHEDWLWRGLTVPVDFFERQIQSLHARGYRGISLSEWFDRRCTGRGADQKLMAPTFDDGYLDNWVFAYPLLKRLGWRGAVYVNPEFVDPGEVPRPNLEDVWAGRCRQEDLVTHGFMNWGELRALAAADVLEIGSHSMTHTWYPIGPRVVDYHRPGGRFPWLAWNARPERKHAYLCENQDGFVRFGAPVYVHGRSLGIRRFLPDPELERALTEHVAAQGGETFFRRADWRSQLDRIVDAVPWQQGRYETDAEMHKRFAEEISGSRRILSERLDRDIRHFCWPGGAYTEESWRLAEAQKFDTIVVNRRDLRRWAHPDPGQVRRLSCHGGITMLGRTFETDDAFLLYHACEVERGRTRHRWPLRWRKLRVLIKRGGRAG